MALPPPPKKDPKSIADAQDEAKKALMDVVPKHGAPVAPAAPAAPALLPPKEPADDDITKGAPRAIIVAEPGEDAPQEETKAAPADEAAPAADEPRPADPPAPVAPPVPEPAAFVGPPATREEEARMAREEEERKAREAKEKAHREKEAEKARWFGKNQASVDEAALAPEKHYADYDFTDVEDRKWEMDQVTMRSYVQLHNEGTRHAVSPAEWASQRADTARKRFGGRGAESDEEFLQEIVKESQGRKDAKDYDDHRTSFIYASAAMTIMDPKAENPYSYEKYMEEARKLPGHNEEEMFRNSLTWKARVDERIKHLSPRQLSLMSVMDGIDGDTPESRAEAIKTLISPDSPIQTFMREYSPRPDRHQLRKSFFKMLENNGLLPSFSTASADARNKTIRRNPDKSWDLPYMKRVEGWVGPLIAVSISPLQSWGARNDLPFANNDPQATQAAFTKFQQEHQIPDSVMMELWSDGVNEFRPWDEGEKVRVFSDGTVVPNPNASEWLDPGEAIKIIQGARAPQDAKAHTLRNLDQILNAVVLTKYKTHSAAAIMGNLTEMVMSHIIPSAKPLSPYHPDEWAKRHNRTDVLTPRFFLDYEQDKKNRDWIASKSEGLEIDFMQGAAGLGAGFGGLIGGVTGSEAITNASQNLHEFSEAAQKGQADTGIFEVPMELAIPVVVDLLTMKAATTSGALLFRGSAKAGQITSMVTMPIIAGSQTYGTAYLQALREENTTHEEAKKKALRAAASSVLIAAAFQGTTGEWKRTLSGVTPDKITVGMLLDSGNREQTIKNLGAFASEMFGALEPKMREEALQHLSANFLNVDPDTNLAEAWDKFAESLGRSLASKSMGELADRMGKSTGSPAKATDLPAMKPAADTSSPDTTAKTENGASAKTGETKATMASEPAPTPPKVEAKASGKEVKPTAKAEKGAPEKSTTKAGTDTKPKPAPKPAAKKTTKPKAKPAAEKPATPPKQTKKKKNPRPKRGGTKKLRYGRENKPDEE